MKQFLMIVTISAYWFVTACNNNVYTEKRNNDTTAIVQAILDSKILDKEFYSTWDTQPLLLYTRFKYRWARMDSIYGTFYTKDSVYVFKGKQVKISDTPYDGTKFYREESLPYPYSPKLDFALGLVGVSKIENDEAWFYIKINEVNISITTHLKKINGKWEVIDYEASQS